MIRCSSYIFCNSNQLWDILDSEIITCMKHTINVRILFRVFTPGRRQSKTPILSRNLNRLIQCFRLPFVAKIVTEFSIAICRHNRKHYFYRFLIRVRRLLIAFLIVAYPVWYSPLKEMAAQVPPPLMLTYSYLFTVFQRRVFFVWHQLAWLCDTDWDSSLETLSSGVSNKVTFKPVSSATETS